MARCSVILVDGVHTNQQLQRVSGLRAVGGRAPRTRAGGMYSETNMHVDLLGLGIVFAIGMLVGVLSVMLTKR